MSNLLRKSCLIISNALNPLLLCSYFFILLFLSTALDLSNFQNIKAILFILGMIFMLTAVLPMISIIILKKFDFDKNPRTQKSLSLLFTSLYYIICFYLFRNAKLLSNDMLLILSIFVFTSIVLGFVSLFKELSLHSASMAAVVGALMVLNLKTETGQFFYPYLLSILLTGITMSLRLYLKKYSLITIYTSTILGFCSTFIPLLILL